MTSCGSDNIEPEIYEYAKARSRLDQLLSDSKLYTSGTDYEKLLDFVVRLREFAPFNAMLLQVQKPGLSYAATAQDWKQRFGRFPKEGARPLLIMWPFGPVSSVYDVADTEGDPLPEDVKSFQATSSIDENKLREFRAILKRRDIDWLFVDAGDRNAGLIQVVNRGANDNETTTYRIHINRNHVPAVQFVTLSHELGHFVLGHLGRDRRLGIPLRTKLTYQEREFEAESVAYIVCGLYGVASKSQQYLFSYVDSSTSLENLDVYQIVRAAGQIETILKLRTEETCR